MVAIATLEQLLWAFSMFATMVSVSIETSLKYSLGSKYLQAVLHLQAIDISATVVDVSVSVEDVPVSVEYVPVSVEVRMFLYQLIQLQINPMQKKFRKNSELF